MGAERRRSLWKNCCSLCPAVSIQTPPLPKTPPTTGETCAKYQGERSDSFCSAGAAAARGQRWQSLNPRQEEKQIVQIFVLSRSEKLPANRSCVQKQPAAPWLCSTVQSVPEVAVNSRCSTMMGAVGTKVALQE